MAFPLLPAGRHYGKIPTLPGPVSREKVIERFEQRGRAVPLVVVGHRRGAAWLQGQAKPGAIKSLDLALLIDREHDGIGGQIDMMHHILQLLSQVWVA